MHKDLPVRGRRLRIVYEFLLSLNLGLLARWAMAQANYASSEIRIKEWVNARLGLHPHSNIGGNTAFLLLALEVTLAVFLVLRVLSRTALSNQFLLVAGGILSMLSLPVSWFYRAYLYELLPGVPNPPHFWLYIELTAVVAFVMLYLLSNSPLPAWTAIGMVVFHFALWACLFPIGAPWLDPLPSIFPLAGLCSSLAWIFYSISTRSQLSPRTLRPN